MQAFLLAGVNQNYLLNTSSYLASIHGVSIDSCIMIGSIISLYTLCGYDVQYRSKKNCRTVPTKFLS